MSPYITFKDYKGEDLVLYILQRDFPHYCASLSYLPISGSMGCVPISGHNLWLNFEGTIRGNYAPAFNDVLIQIEITLADMARWFYLNRVAPDPKRYKKWAIPTS